MDTRTTKEIPMAVTTTRERRRIENQERALAVYQEHHAAAVALLSRIQVAITNHDLAPDPEAISWATVGDMERARHDLQEISDYLFNEGEYAEA